MRVCKHSLFGRHTFINVFRRNLKTFQTQSFPDTRKVISSTNNKYRNWRKICQVFIWVGLPYPFPVRNKKEEKEELALCLPWWSWTVRPRRGSSSKEDKYATKCQKTSKCKETRKNCGKEHLLYAPYFQRNHVNYISLKSLWSIKEKF